MVQVDVNAGFPGPAADTVAQAPAAKHQPRLLILIDGVYFQTAMRSAGMHYHVDFPRLARTLPSKVDGGCILVKLRFYVAESPYPNGRQRERPLFDALRNSPSTELVLGWHITKSCKACGEEYHREKGTDVAIATALIDGAYKDLYDTALLVTGDEDYVPAIEAVKNVQVAAPRNPGMEKRVIWGHFGTQATNGRLAQACNSSFLFEDKFMRTVDRPNINRNRR